VTLVPVIMCGGSGVRLWPASRPSRPKQFIPLVGERSSFQQTALRVAGLPGVAEILIVAGLRHESILHDQLAAIDVRARLILEPAARDSAAAMAAAAYVSLKSDPDAVMVVVASDHHIPDDAAFQDAVLTAAQAARDGLIVTLGVRPAEPSTAYGYIKPAVDGGGLQRVEAFVEKPVRAVAEHYVEAGYLWNSGNFIVRADRLLAELELYAPDVLAAAREGVETIGERGELGPAFGGAPKISIDYAVMEKTRHAAVLPVDFVWSDLGAWDAIRAVSSKDSDGNAIEGDVWRHATSNNLIRAEGVTVVAIGVHNLAIIAKPDAVLVCALDAVQDIKITIDRMALAGSPAVDIAPSEDLATAAQRLKRWLDTQALPLWYSLALEPDRGFAEAMDDQATALWTPRRARVQLRQAFVYARAQRLGWGGQGLAAARTALAAFETSFRRADGWGRATLAADGSILDDSAMIYDQAFNLLAWSETGDEAKALALLDALETRRHAAGGFIEQGDQRFQSNPHMHLFEAALAWIEAGGGPRWRALADELAELALTRFMDQDGGFLREFFDADWRPASGRVEPGHQFEWAWLLMRWSRMAGEPRAAIAAQRLYQAGLKGIDARRGVAIDALSDDLTVLEPGARLWPQTEWLKAAVILNRPADALKAASALTAYLDMPVAGLWRDKMQAGGGFVQEPAPASSLYHIAVAIEVLTEGVGQQA
jgi:mannose-1-phosphate guanylyltransferase/mannose-6-phosphate isomerase